MYVNNKIIIYKSRAIDYEISRISDGDKRRQVEDLYDGLELENIPYTYELDKRVEELEKIRRDGLKALKEKLGVEGMIKFIQMYSDGKGDYTKERRENLKNLDKEDLQNFLREELN